MIFNTTKVKMNKYKNGHMWICGKYKKGTKVEMKMWEYSERRYKLDRKVDECEDDQTRSWG